MNEVTKQLVSQLQAAGQKKEAIFAQLLAQGHAVDDINEAFAELAAPQKAEAAAEASQKRTISIVVSIGAILIALGIFSFVAANWQYFSSFAKVAILLVTLVAVNLLGWYLQEKKGYPRAGSALFFLGCCVYGASIFLVAQIFHIRTNWPDGFILWMLGTIAMAFALDQLKFLALAFIVGLIAVVGQPFELFEDPFNLKSFALTPNLLLVLATVVCLAVGSSLRKRMMPEEKEYF